MGGVHPQRLTPCLQGHPLHRSIDAACVLQKTGNERHAYLHTISSAIAGRPCNAKACQGLLRSDFQVPRTRLKFGERAFSVAAAKSWNNLPLHVRTADNTDTFKRRLKTFLFCTFYQQPLPTAFL